MTRTGESTEIGIGWLGVRVDENILKLWQRILNSVITLNAIELCIWNRWTVQNVKDIPIKSFKNIWGQIIGNPNISTYQLVFQEISCVDIYVIYTYIYLCNIYLWK